MAKKKKKNQYSKIQKVVFIAIVCFCFFAFAYNSYLKSDYVPNNDKVVNSDINQQHISTATVTDPSNLLTEQQKNLLSQYATAYKDTLLDLQPADISPLYINTASAGYNLNKAALELITTVRTMRDIDLSLDYATVEYTIESVDKISSNKVKVHLLESNTQKFKHLSQPSMNANINHWFTLEEINGNWYIELHEHEEDFYLLAGEGWQAAGGSDYVQRGKDTVDIIVADARENLADLSQFQQGTYRTDLTVKDTSYNREKAVDYAQQWWNGRNYGGNYLIYDDFGGNCQNFASQCLHAGGIKMDYTGILDLQWKFYDENLNTRQTARGRSYSWTGVDMFYNYALHNYSDGLVSLTDIPYSYAQKGDIIHVGAYNDWRHALVVTDVLKDTQGNLIDIVVASNTADRWNYPLSAYIYTAPRLIHILGQN